MASSGTALAVPLATCFGCGRFPWGPGTIGSLVAILVAALLHSYLHSGRWLLIVLLCVLLLPAVWSATVTARALGKKDPGQVVIDEVLGQWVTLLGASSFRWQSLLSAFVLFRIFDIWKPWPVRQFEKLPEGWGIVADDLAAGVYGMFILYLVETLRLY